MHVSHCVRSVAYACNCELNSVCDGSKTSGQQSGRQQRHDLRTPHVHRPAGSNCATAVLPTSAGGAVPVALTGSASASHNCWAAKECIYKYVRNLGGA